MKDTSIISILLTVPADLKEGEETGMSGGNRIMFESIKNWTEMIDHQEIITCRSGKRMIEANIKNLDRITIRQIWVPGFLYKNLLLLFLYKTIVGSLYMVLRSYRKEHKTIIFSSSDIFPDSIPAFFAKLFHPKLKWAAAFYFFASKPFSKEFPYKGIGAIARGMLYFYSQSICYFLIRKFSDFVVACNEIDRKRFIAERYAERNICAIYGGVDLQEAEAVAEPAEKKYAAVYMARFHPQKGPLIAAQVWNEVVKQQKNFRLAMIGNGPDEEIVKAYIKDHNLSANIDLLGFMDGQKKYKVLKSAKVFLHTPVYDTGGMAAAEGMAARLPVLAFDLDGFDYCYPQGIIRVSPVGDYVKMAKVFLKLIADETLYNQTQSEALELVQEWDWKNRADFILRRLTSC